MKENNEKKERNSKENSKLIKAFPKSGRRKRKEEFECKIETERKERPLQIMDEQVLSLNVFQIM